MAVTKSCGESLWIQWPALGMVCIWARGKSRLISGWWLGLSTGGKATKGVKVGRCREKEMWRQSRERWKTT